MVEQYEERIMNTGQGIKNTLVEVDDSMLIVIDVQDCFLRKYDDARSQEIVARVVWLLHTAGLGFDFEASPAHYPQSGLIDPYQ